MSTRCYIVKKIDEEFYLYNYIHHDGYPSYVGRILLECYNTEEKVDKLFLNSSGFSCLEENPDNLEPYETAFRCMPESDFEQPITNLFDAVDYVYIWKNGKWYITGSCYMGNYYRRKMNDCYLFDKIEIDELTKEITERKR